MNFCEKVKKCLSFIWRKTTNPFVRTPDHRHLDAPNRHLLSAISAAEIVSGIVFRKEHVLEVIRTCPQQQPQIARVSVLEKEIRLNLYRLEKFANGPLTPAFNPNWTKDGIIDFMIALRLVDRSQNGGHAPLWPSEYQLLTRPVRNDLSYDVYEPYASLSIPLDDVDVEHLSFVTSLHVRLPNKRPSDIQESLLNEQ